MAIRAECVKNGKRYSVADCKIRDVASESSPKVLEFEEARRVVLDVVRSLERTRRVETVPLDAGARSRSGVAAIR